MPASPVHTQACVDRDFAEWHQGCAWCAVWVLDVDVPAVRQRVAQGRGALAPWLLPTYERQPHITLGYRGLVDDGCGHPAAQYGVAELQADMVRLQQLPPCGDLTVALQGVGSFDTVPYLALADAAALQPWHDALAPQPLWPDWRYVPHVTLGHYAQTTPLAPLLQRLHAAVGQAPALHCTVTALSLVRYRSAAIAGPLTLEGRWDLRQRRYVPQPGALLRP